MIIATWTSSKCTIFISVVDIKVYTPYFAQWPMESNRASPHQTTSLVCFARSMSEFLQVSQYFRIDGMINIRWCLKNVLGEYAHKPICRKIRITLLIDAPANNVPKLNSMFPAGNRPNIYGCDRHVKPLMQWLHSWYTVTIVPSFFIVTLGFSALQLKQNRLNRLRSMPQNTINFGSLLTGVPGSTLWGKKNKNFYQLC